MADALGLGMDTSVQVGRGPNGAAHAVTPEDVLLRRIGDGHEAALAELYQRHGGLVHTVALRILGDRDLAEEVMQDTFLRCWDGAESYDPSRGRVGAWLMGIARNRAIDLLRSRQHRARQRERDPLPSARPGTRGLAADSDEEAAVLRHSVQDALQELPAEQRCAIQLAYFGGMSQSEIARELGEPLGTIKTRIRTGMQRLRGLLRSFVETETDDGEGRHDG